MTEQVFYGPYKEHVAGCAIEAGMLVVLNSEGKVEPHAMYVKKGPEQIKFNETRTL